MKRGILIATILTVVFATTQAQTRLVTLLAPTQAVEPKALVTVRLVSLNTSADEMRIEPEETLLGKIVGASQQWDVVLAIDTRANVVISPGAFAYSTYRLQLPPGAVGRLVLELERPSRVRAVIDVDAATQPAAPAVAGVPVAEHGGPKNVAATGSALASFQRSFASHFSEHYPIYFIGGAEKPAAKFQFSFKYRILGDQSALGTEHPSLRSVYFGYTQRSLWDITSSSSPFYDTSYMPELMVEALAARQPGVSTGLQWLGAQAAFQHESNGRDGPASRSLNIVYVRPMVSLGSFHGYSLVFAPKLFAYVDQLTDNPDLRRYRGYGEYTFSVWKNDGIALTALGRIGDQFDRGSIQIDLSYPLRARFGDFASFVLLQYFDGYGESLLHYNQRSSTLRAGFSFVR